MPTSPFSCLLSEKKLTLLRKQDLELCLVLALGGVRPCHVCHLGTVPDRGGGEVLPFQINIKRKLLA